MLIGEFSRHCHVSVRMIRYYESQGLLRPARKASGYRVYDHTDVEIVERIIALNTAGLTLKTIRGLLPCAHPGTLTFRPCAELQNQVRRTLTELDAQIATLSQSRHFLARYLIHPD